MYLDIVARMTYLCRIVVVVVVVAIVGLRGSVDALECYNCVTDHDPKCGDPFSNTSVSKYCTGVTCQKTKGIIDGISTKDSFLETFSFNNLICTHSKYITILNVPVCYL